MTSEDSTEVFRDNIQCEQDANVSLIETERSEEDDHQHDKDDEQHDEDYQRHDEEQAYTPNVPVYNPYDVLRLCTNCGCEEIDYIGKADVEECEDAEACDGHTGDLFYKCQNCLAFICSECIEINHKL